MKSSFFCDLFLPELVHHARPGIKLEGRKESLAASGALFSHPLDFVIDDALSPYCSYTVCVCPGGMILFGGIKGSFDAGPSTDVP